MCRFVSRMDIGQFLVWSRSPALPVSACPAWVADGASRPAKRLSRCFVRGTGPSPQNCRGDRRSFTFFKLPRDEAKFFISQRTNASEREREWCVCVGARRAGGGALPRACASCGRWRTGVGARASCGRWRTDVSARASCRRRWRSHCRPSRSRPVPRLRFLTIRRSRSLVPSCPVRQVGSRRHPVRP